MATYPSVEASGFQPNPYFAQARPYQAPPSGLPSSQGQYTGMGLGMPGNYPGSTTQYPNPGEGLVGGDYRVDRLAADSRLSTNPWFADFMLGSNGRQGVLPNAEALYKAGPSLYYPGQTQAGFTGDEVEGQRQLRSYASQNLPGIVNMAQQGAGQLIGGGLGAGLQSPTSQSLQGMMQNGGMNPMLQQAGSGSLSPHYQGVLQGGYNDAFRQYGNTVDDISQTYETGMHSADDAALLSGNFGGSRGEIARGIVGREATKAQGRAQQGLSENMSQAYAGVMNQQFSDARTAQLQAGLGASGNQLDASRIAAGLYGTDVSGRIAGVNAMGDVANLGMLPGEIYGAIGAQRRDMDQSQINAEIDRFNFNQQAPWNNLNNYGNVVGSMMPFGQLGYFNQTGAAGPGSQWAGAIGGGLAGAGAGALAGSKIGAVGGGWGALAGAGIGAIGGYLGSR